jgi:hypothetical protein
MMRCVGVSALFSGFLELRQNGEKQMGKRSGSLPREAWRLRGGSGGRQQPGVAEAFADRANRGVTPGGGSGRERERRERVREANRWAGGEWALPSSKGRREGVNGRWAPVVV